MNFRNILIGAAAAGALISIAGVASAAPVQAQAGASATIVAPAAIQATQALAFGTIAKPTTGTNTVTVGASTADAQTPSLGNSGNGYITQTGQARAAVFRLTGTSGSTVTSPSATITFGGDNSQLGLATGQNAIAAELVNSPATLNSSGFADVIVGGAITITNNTTVKTYNGTVTLNVDFN